MTKLLAAVLIIGSSTVACATESKLKLDISNANVESNREVAQTGVEHPESLQYESKEYKEHKEFLKMIDTRYNR